MNRIFTYIQWYLLNIYLIDNSNTRKIWWLCEIVLWEISFL